MASIGLAGCSSSGSLSPAALPAQDRRGYYPPALHGLRGSHPGAYEVAHALRDGRRWDEVTDTGEMYDLIVVGGASADSRRPISIARRPRARCGS